MIFLLHLLAKTSPSQARAGALSIVFKAEPFATRMVSTTTWIQGCRDAPFLRGPGLLLDLTLPRALQHLVGVVV